MEIRATKTGDAKKLIGYAATYNTISTPIPTGSGSSFREKIAPGAFDGALASNPDVVMTLNHDRDQVLGRTTAGTLKLTTDKKGLRFECTLPNTTFANDLYENVRAGNMNGCSFAFADVEDEWSEGDESDLRSNRFHLFDSALAREADVNTLRGLYDAAKQFVLRTIKKFRKLIDVSIVTHPAYPGTTVSARNLAAAAEFRASFAEELRANVNVPDFKDSIRRRKLLLNSILI